MLKARFLPKQDTMVCVLQKDLITISDFDGDEPDEVLIKVQDAIDFDFQPMGEHMIVVCKHEWLFIELQSGSILHRTPSQDQTCVKFHPDGILLAVGHSNGCMNIWDIRSQNLIKTIEAP